MRFCSILLSLLIIISLLSCCHHHRHHSNVSFGFIFAPISIGRASYQVYVHDDHIHDEFCGHPRRWYNGRWVYFYNGRWEYYDYEEQVYYYIPSELLEGEGE
ncbi:MAG: hypothetical protein ACP5QK_06260 [Myxococcota bacterium]